MEEIQNKPWPSFVMSSHVSLPHSHASALVTAPSAREHAFKNEHCLVALWQYRPMNGLHDTVSLVPHAQSWLLGDVPFELMQGSPALQLLDEASQKSPVTSVQDAVPHVHGALLAAEAVVMVHSSAAKQRQYSESEEQLPMAVERVLKRG
jgi:hypothetical protein